MGTQVWEVGRSVAIGGHKQRLIIMEELPPRKPGEAKRWLLQTGDGQKAYEWVPFKGLTLVRGELVRARRRRRTAKGRVAKKATAKVASTKQAIAPKGGLWHRLKARFGRRVKPPSNVTITRPPGAAIDP